MTRPLLLALLLASPAAALAQGVTIAPTTVFIDARSRSGTILLFNPNPQPAEVEVSAFYAVPASDTAGTLRLQEGDSLAPRSAVPWIRIFPRRATIAPGANQTLRVLVSPPATVPDGEYWARVRITARGGAPPVTVADSGGVQASLSLVVNSLLPLLYRKGAVSTGVTISGLVAEVTADSVVVRGRLARTGNAAALVTARGALVDDGGAVRATSELPTSVYDELVHRWTFPRAGLAAGAYLVRVEVEGVRADLGAANVLAFPPVRDSIRVAVP